MSRNHWMLLAAVPLLVGASACSDDGTTPEVEEETRLLSVVPEGGATDVDPNGPIEVRFGHPMMSGMEDYALLHLGDVTGPEVVGTWSLSPDGTLLTFTAESPLQPATRYTIHLGGGMMDEGGRPIDWQIHGSHMGGEWANDAMMGSGMGGGMGMGGAVGAGHMGSGWEHPNGSYGMIFAFTTAEWQGMAPYTGAVESRASRSARPGFPPRHTLDAPRTRACRSSGGSSVESPDRPPRSEGPRAFDGRSPSHA